MNTVDDSRLERYGENESKLLQIDGLCSAGKIRRALIRDLKIIDGMSAHIADWAHTRQSIPQEFEWLLDNRYLCEREGKEAALDLRGGNLLPRDAQTGNPTLYTAVTSLVRATRGGITMERLTSFLSGFQTEKAFTERELSLLIPMLRAALIATVSQTCLKMRAILTGYKQDPRRNPFAAERAIQTALSQGSAPPSGLDELAEAAKTRHIELSELIGSAITSLRFLSGTDFSELLMNSSVVERVLSNDPSGHYSKMSEETRMYYRLKTARLARKRRMSEQNAARACISLAERSGKHVGFYIFREPLGKKRRSSAGFFYFSALFAVTVFIMSTVFAFTEAWYAPLLALLPALDVSKNLCDFFAVRLKRPGFIPRMDCKDGLPADAATLCVITSLLSRSSDGKELAKKLERYYLCNRDAGAHTAFGLLCDFPDAKTPSLPEDDETTEVAAAAISELNRRYPAAFYLFVRERQFNAGERCYMGYERKRGALAALMRTVRGKAGGVTVRAGDASRLGDFKFLITLDSDTRLSAGTLRPLAAAMLHPLNTPVISKRRRVVVQGHAMLQPRMAVDLKSASRNFFTRLFAGQGGLDPYNGNVSDVYQDLFGRGMFMGKGIIHIDAFLRCLDGRLPQNRILSHDLLEGSYLRAGFIGDIEWSDGYPERVSAWMERNHRWARGDWQIASWVGSRVKTFSGYEENPLDELCRFQIFDNLRRSLTPFSLLIILTLACVFGGYTWAVLTVLAIVTLSSQLIISAGQLAARGGARGGQRFHSTIITGIKAVFLQTAAQLSLLSMRGLYDIHAALAALWRLNVSRRRLLSWRTAASADKKAARTVLSYYKQFFFAALWGVSLCFSGAAGVILGLTWLLSPWMAAIASKPRKAGKRITEEDRLFLLRHAKLMWDYFSENITEADHYLPPDNWQEQPAAGLARRTSPTNIGLGLLSAIAALDMELADTETVLRFVDKMLTSVEQLQKWNGHLYNWYDTATLQTLRPMCVSTVDSGNLAGYLLTAQAALAKLNDAAAQDLAGRAGALYDAMDFRPLYDTQRQLFYIGYDLEINRPTESYYDLLASEARQTGYIAIARGQIPRNHWRRLGRVLSAHNRYSGMVSWTGTMFEYFMPHLIIPVYENSLIYESLRFAVYCQQKRGERLGIPWGISESCFFAFDGALNYQYKAHGEPRLAYKRGLGHEHVISPYSTFLALNIAPRKAIANLKRLESLGLVGRYGFCEAADFTPARVTANNRFMPVKCYMAHHLGMSLLAVDNLLNDNIMVSRFMSDPETSAYSELLEEKIPTAGITMKPRGKEVPEKPARNVVTGWLREFESVDPARPRCSMLSNGSYTLFCTDGGLTASTSGNMALTRFEPDTLKHGLGWSFFLSCGELWTSLTPLLAPHEDMRYSVSFDIDSVSWKARGENVADGIHATVTARVPNNEGAEQRSVLLHNSGKTARTFELFSYFEPVLSSAEHYESHPAFSKLFLQSEIGNNCIKFHRRARGERGDAHMTVACDAVNAKFDTSRELALSRGGASVLRYARPEHGTQGAPLDPCALIRVPVTLDSGDSCIINFAMAAAGTAADATAAAVRTLSLENDMASSTDTMSLLGLTPAESHAALDWLTDLVFISEARLRQAYDITHNTMGQSVLWQWGISGDLPIVVAMGADAQPERLSRLLRMYRYLSLCGTQFDFVVLTQDGSDYRRPQRTHISETLKSIGCEGFLGARAGVHIVDAPSLSPHDAYLLMSSASLALDGQRPEQRHGDETFKVRIPAPPIRPSNAQPPVTRYLDDGSFQFDINGELPRAAWGHTLTNNAFGALIRDTGFGHVWRKNSRENKLTPWDNDPLVIHGDETMRLLIGDRDISPFADADGHLCTVTYGFGYAVYEKDIGEGVKIVTTAFVPYDRMARVVKLDVFGAQSARLKHFTRLVMGSKRAERRYIVTEKTRLSLTARNAHNTAYEPQKVVFSSLPSPAAFTCDVNAWNSDHINGQCGAGLEPCFAAVTELIPQGEMLSAVVVLGAAQNEKGVALIENLADFGQFGAELERTKAWWRERVCPRPVVTRSPVMDRYLNGWALYQVIANRLFARASFYQCGGAYGFRDQLQDVCAALYTTPRLAKNQILRACAHQFEEGDVQHWWHPARRHKRKLADRGVRTRISDDLLWLPYTVCEYIDKTGDMKILEYSTPYLSAEPLPDDVHDRFEIPRVTAYRESVFRHCVRAIECVIGRGTGANGLLLILGGDWNDGFDRVGAEGRGESTWLTWFAAHVFERFANLCDEDYARRLRELSATLGNAADNMWDGAWYKRGTFDSGAPLGSSRSDECKIDSIAQSFSALSPQATHTRKALESAYEHLVEGNIIKLFTPPFDKTKRNPGYIKGYLPGVRENGGQYTHAAVWLAMAHFLDGQRERGLELLEKLLPGNHGSEYVVEPHVLAADVYSNPEHFGRGGWTHYTGAAAWYYRVAMEYAARLPETSETRRLTT